LEHGCPVCNGMAGITETCPQCGKIMGDEGMVEDYYGPYSPYDNMDLYEQTGFWILADRLPCVHLFSCPACGYDTRIGFPQVILEDRQS